MFDILFTIWLWFMFMKLAVVAVFVGILVLTPGTLFATYIINRVREKCNGT